MNMTIQELARAFAQGAYVYHTDSAQEKLNDLVNTIAEAHVKNYRAPHANELGALLTEVASYVYICDAHNARDEQHNVTARAKCAEFEI